jgi:tight adherence protein B
LLSAWSLSLCAAGLLCWPTCDVSTRLAALGGHRRRLPLPGWIRLVRRFGLGFALVAIAMAVIGPAGALATALLAAACWREWRSRHVASAKILAAEGISEALQAMVAELRAGAHPVTAAESAAADAAPQAVESMRLIAVSARLDGDPGDGAEDGVLGQFARAWSLVRRHGLPMADVLDAVRRDVVAGVRFTRQTHARMAGPRASAVVLALLPSLGVALGEAMGADPLRILLSTPPGQFLLMVGCALIWAGLAWSAKITELAVLR